jgi:hypothetical protein
MSWCRQKKRHAVSETSRRCVLRLEQCVLCVCWQDHVGRSARAWVWTVLQPPRRCAAARTSKVRLRFRSVEAVSIEHLHVEPVQVIQWLFSMKTVTHPSQLDGSFLLWWLQTWHSWYMIYSTQSSTGKGFSLSFFSFSCQPSFLWCSTQPNP